MTIHNEQEMEEKKKANNPMRNPCAGAITCLGSAAGAALGAEIRHHSVHDAAIAYLVGSSITGAIAGTVGMFTISNTEDESICSSVLRIGLPIAAIVTAPIMAELFVDNSSSPMETVVDCLIGSATITGGALGIAALVATPYIVGYGWNYAGTLFGGSAPQTNNYTHQGNNDDKTNVIEITLGP